MTLKCTLILTKPLINFHLSVRFQTQIILNKRAVNEPTHIACFIAMHIDIFRVFACLTITTANHVAPLEHHITKYTLNW